MKNYFTFFLCSRDWGHVAETVFPVIQKLLDSLPSSRKIQASAQLKSNLSGGPARIVSGSYQRLRKELQPENLVQLSLEGPGQTPAVHEFFLFFENIRYQHTPEYLRFLFPQAPERVEASGDFKIFSFSVSYDLFKRGLVDAQREMLERLFVAANGVYGFGNATTWPIAGPFQLVRDNSPQEKRRIVDFDYARQIEDVYLYNYLSASHLRAIAGLGEMCGSSRLECKQLFDEGKQQHGLAVYLKDDADADSLVQGYLRNLIPISGASAKSFQLLLPGALDPAHRNKLETYSFAVDVKELPDFVCVALRAPLTVPDNQQFYAELADFFERLRPGIVQRGIGITESIVQYPGFFEPDHIVQRIPYRRLERSADESDYVKVYFTSGAIRARLKVLFLMNAGVDRSELAALVREWGAVVDRHPDAYGSVDTIEELSSWAIENKTHAKMVIDATHLRPDGFNLLVLMLDHLNRADLIVRYVVCGDLPQTF